MEIQTRLATPDDLDALVGLVLQWRDLLQHSSLDTDDLRDSIARLLQDPNTDFLVATSPAGSSRSTRPKTPESRASAENLPGFGQQRYRYSLWLGREEAYLEDIFVVEEARSQGIGTRLMELAIERAKARNCAQIALYTNSANAESIALYERLGFESNTSRFPDSPNFYFVKGL